MKNEVLKQKWYYRLLKVLFILIYVWWIILLGIGFYFYFNEHKPQQVIDFEKTTITCKETGIIRTTKFLENTYNLDTTAKNVCNELMKIGNEIYKDRTERQNFYSSSKIRLYDYDYFSDKSILNRLVDKYESIYKETKEYREEGLTDTEILDKISLTFAGRIINNNDEMFNLNFDAKYEIDYVFKKEESWLKAIGGTIGFFILSILGLIIIMELIIRIFFYIITGKFKK